MKLKPGERLQSQVCTTSVVVVRTSPNELDLRCGDQPLIPAGSAVAPAIVTSGERPAVDGPGSVVGKRYVDQDTSIELLCVKPGDGTLNIGGVPLQLKQSKALPSSD